MRRGATYKEQGVPPFQRVPVLQEALRILEIVECTYRHARALQGACLGLWLALGDLHDIKARKE